MRLPSRFLAALLACTLAASALAADDLPELGDIAGSEFSVATERKLGEDALKWAREQGVRYAVSGSVEEWRYKVGLDGEPVAALTLRVIEVESGRVVWSASGARSGWSRDGLSAIAHQLVSQLLAGLPLAGGKPAP